MALRGRVDNNESGFATMRATVQKQAVDGEPIAAARQSPNPPVVDFLIARDVVVYPVNSTAIFDYRKSLVQSGSQSDTAEWIARYLFIHHQQLRAFCRPEPRLRQRQLLIEDRDKWVAQKVRQHHQLRDTLLGYYPQAVMAKSDLASKTALSFLSQFPTPESLSAQTDETWEAFLNDHHVYHKKARQRFLDAIRQNPLTVDIHVVAAKSLFTQTIVSQLQLLTQALNVYEQRISKRLSDFDDFDRFASLPLVDIVLGAKLLIAIFTSRQRQ